MAGRKPAPGNTTRLAIIEAAMRGFAENGYAATGIREIAALAGTNVASISYHFGGKEGLRAACAERIVEVLGGVLDAAQPGALPSRPEEAEAALAGIVRTMARFILLEPEAGLVAGFILREMAAPSGALDTIYDGLFERVHRRACALWGIATGRDPEGAPVRIAVFGAIGQLVYFHIARPVVLRRMDWPGIGPDEAAQIADGLVATLAARLAADRRTS